MSCDVRGWKCVDCGNFVSSDEAFNRNKEEHSCVCIDCETKNIKFIGEDL